MKGNQGTDTKRKRAPSKRSLATRERVLDAAESVFANRGFDGATIRDIATEAGEPIGTIHHHGGGKEALFHQTVARRAEALSRARLEALEQAKRTGVPTLERVLDAFMRPFFALSAEEGRWRNYARLIAFVSVDDRWREISAQYFDPTATVFIGEIHARLPHMSKQQVAEGFVFSVSAMLALLTSRDRICALGARRSTEDVQFDHLVRFCAAGFES
ncbi:MULTISPECIES: TetR/AcrR family transcriptional regulator [Roseobacteraceae]|jgi:AcrR family transcriptional regulator|uniref:Transcriptional regulator BetI n=1 Tax=Pseudosulfitobacter pseudonitzschiae TaxID=1402135 RepID=A0A221JZQ8_9RHOB|nr:MULTISPECIES: TetR/AcrR family transcriptional regulator [Roseobacteraceae]ASM72209.1 transcriptional regulator BetI [Pseudosulfitobacter pseudonitzschiae]